MVIYPTIDSNTTLLTTWYFQHHLKNFLYVFYSEVVILISFRGFNNGGVGVGVL